jgi:hypothetical protein
MSVKGILLQVLCLTTTLAPTRWAHSSAHPAAVLPVRLQFCSSGRIFQPQGRWGNIHEIPCENFTKRKSERFHFYFNLLVTRCINKFNIQQLYALPTLYLCVL